MTQCVVHEDIFEPLMYNYAIIELYDLVLINHSSGQNKVSITCSLTKAVKCDN